MSLTRKKKSSFLVSTSGYDWMSVHENCSISDKTLLYWYITHLQYPVDAKMETFWFSAQLFSVCIHFICSSFLSFRAICLQADVSRCSSEVIPFSVLCFIYLISAWQRKVIPASTEWWKVKHDWPVLEPSDRSSHRLDVLRENINFHFDFTAGRRWALISSSPFLFMSAFPFWPIT